MAHDKPKLISFPRLSLGSLSNGIVRSIKFTGNEIKKAGIKLNTIDTTYISPNQYNLAFMLEQSSWYEHYRLVNPEKPDVPINKNDAFQKVQKRRVQEKR